MTHTHNNSSSKISRFKRNVRRTDGWKDVTDCFTFSAYNVVGKYNTISQCKPRNRLGKRPQKDLVCVSSGALNLNSINQSIKYEASLSEIGARFSSLHALPTARMDPAIKPTLAAAAVGGCASKRRRRRRRRPDGRR